jgi:hypothetical protein
VQAEIARGIVTAIAGGSSLITFASAASRVKSG